MPTFLSNQVEEETIVKMMDVVKENYPLLQRYYKLKAKMLKLDKLKGYDRSAPIGQPKPIKWDQAKKNK